MPCWSRPVTSAGTLAGGLLVYDRSSERWTEVRDGLPSANVTALAEHNGWIYVGTDNGLVRFSEGELVTR
jgi:ligand-binding sensor domain-containing protein